MSYSVEAFQSGRLPGSGPPEAPVRLHPAEQFFNEWLASWRYLAGDGQTHHIQCVGGCGHRYQIRVDGELVYEALAIPPLN